MSCKCDEIGDYSDCPRHGNGTEWAKKQELGEPIKRRYEREKLLIAVVAAARRVIDSPRCWRDLVDPIFALDALDSVKEK